MAINIDDYMAANPLLTFTEALQEAVTLQKPVFFPAISSWRTQTNPVVFADFLYLFGEQGNQISLIDFSNILSTDFNGRPMFIGGKYDVSDNFTGWYADCNGVYRTVYRGATPSGADTDWETAYTTDPIADLKLLDASLGLQFITIRDMTIHNDDSYGSIINSHLTYQSVFRDCTFSGKGQGLTLNGTFQTSIENCNFSGGLPSWLWMDTAVWDRFQAGTETADDIAIKANIDYRNSRAWALYVGGNAAVTNCRFVWVGTGFVFNGNGCIGTGLYIEKCFRGLVAGRMPFMDINTLASQLLTTNKLVSGLPSASGVAVNQRAYVTDSTVTFTNGIGNIVAGGGSNTALVYSDGTNWRIGNIPIFWGTTGGKITSVEMESCYEGILLLGCGTPFEGTNIIGGAANQYDGTVGPPLYGIGTITMARQYSGIFSTVSGVGGDESVRSISLDVVQGARGEEVVVPGGTNTPVVINEVVADFPRARITALESDVTTLDTAKATVESVEAVDHRVTALDTDKASLEDLNNVATVVADQYYPTS